MKARSRGVPPMLRAYRWVFGHAKDRDRTEGHRKAREMYELDGKVFLKRLEAMESEWSSTVIGTAKASATTKRAEAMKSASVLAREEVRSARGKGEGVEEDIGTARCLALVEGWLKERGEESA